jgi:hypothetical protein
MWTSNAKQNLITRVDTIMITLSIHVTTYKSQSRIQHNYIGNWLDISSFCMMHLGSGDDGYVLLLSPFFFFILCLVSFVTSRVYFCLFQVFRLNFSYECCI